MERAKVSLFAIGATQRREAGYAAYDWFRVSARSIVIASSVSLRLWRCNSRHRIAHCDKLASHPCG